MYLYFCNHCCVIVAYRNEWNKMQHESACVVLRETSCHRIAAWKRSKHRISRISRFSARIKSAIPSIARDSSRSDLEDTARPNFGLCDSDRVADGSGGSTGKSCEKQKSSAISAAGWMTDDVAVVASFPPRNAAERRSVSKKGKTLSRTASIE